MSVDPALAQLVDWARLDTESLRIPDAVIAAASDRVLDIAGVAAVGALTDESVGLSHAFNATAHGDGFITPIGRVRSAPDAAFACAAVSHLLDFDDSHSDSRTHPSAVVLPAAWIAGQLANASFAEVVAASVVGYEVLIRLASLAPEGALARGFHPTASLGPVAAAVVAARLLCFDRERTLAAVGISVSLASGTTQSIHEGKPGKAYAIGQAASAGVLAALVAGRGAITPLDDPITGAAGLVTTHTGRDLAEAFAAQTATLGTQWHSSQISHKQYPCTHLIHAAVEAVLALRAEHPDVGAPERIVVTVPEWYVPLVWDPVDVRRHPQTPYAARFSIAFVVASAWLHGRVTVSTFDASTLDDAEVRDLSDVVEIAIESFPEFPASYPAAVTVFLGGHATSARVVPVDDLSHASARLRRKAIENLTICVGASEASERVTDFADTRIGARSWTTWLEQTWSARMTETSPKHPRVGLETQ